MDIITDPKFVLLSATALLFIVLGHYNQGTIQEPLKQTLLKIGYVRLDWWSVSHYVFFLILGLWYPGRPWFFLFFGVFWELMEDFLAKDSDTQLVDCTKKGSGGFIDFWCNGYADDYWYGKADDVVVNMLGYLSGWGLRAFASKANKLNISLQ